MSESDNSVSNDLLDLRLLPSWLKEGSDNSKTYANFEGDDRPSRRDGREDFRRGPRPSQNRSDSRGPNRGSNSPGGSRPPQARDGRPPGSRDSRPGGDNRGPRRPDSRSQGSRPPDSRQRDSRQGHQGERPARQEERPAPVEIRFLPEVHALENVTEQLRSSPVAYPLFAVAKMFLSGPKRHNVEIKPLQDARLYKLEGTVHLSTDRSRLEAIAFKELGEKYFAVEITEAPEIKGNFNSVARSSLTGKVFGPTSHHTYQTAIHKEYEERFSRRMSFADYQRSIETTRDAAEIERWKTDSRRIETYRLRDLNAEAVIPDEEKEVQETTEPLSTPENEAATDTVDSAISDNPEAPTLDQTPERSETGETTEPASEESPTSPEEIVGIPQVAVPTGPSFASPQEAEAYFRKEILPNLIVETLVETLAGQQSRDLTDRKLSAAVRNAWEAEMKYPLGVVNAIRVKFNEQNLHIFKFKKRVLLISSLKPVYMDDKSESLSVSIRTVLQTIHEFPGIDRKGLAEKILNADASASDEDKQTRKNALIGDLYWLVRQGNVIEFSDGTFDLPLGPKAVLVEAAHESSDQSEPIAKLVDESSLAPQEQ